jgi:predicted AlkP superfamily phosphohydrolase/phosphomutase
MEHKVVVIGLDGATFDLIKPWVTQGLFPNFCELLRKGAHAELISTIPPLTAPAWTSMVTGKNPGKHGIFGFLQQKPNSYETQLVSATSRKADSIWKILGEAGKRVIVVNVPMTYPPEPVNGVLVSGMDAPGISSDFVYPESLKENLLRMVPDYEIALHFSGYLDSFEKRQDGVNVLLQSVDKRLQLTSYLMHNQPWDFLMVVFTASDKASHYYWKYMDQTHPSYDPMEAQKLGTAIQLVYKKLDDTLGVLVNDIPEQSHVLLVSDHGFGPLNNTLVSLPTWLGKQGLLVWKNESRGLSVDRWFSSTLRKVASSGYSFLLSALSSGQKDMLSRLLPGVREKVDTLRKMSMIDWSRTRVYADEDNMSLRVNLAGREPKGIVPQSEYDAVCELVVEGLENLVDPYTGEHVIDRVCHRDEIYTGPWVDWAPDLVVKFRDYAYRCVSRKGSQKRPSVVEKVPDDWGLSGFHRPNGIFAVRGPGIREGVESRALRIEDVFPLILRLMRVPVPDDIDGKLPVQLFTQDFANGLDTSVIAAVDERTAFPSEPGNSYSNSEEEEIRERLRSLGYIE